jgi:hypothetical protein
LNLDVYKSKKVAPKNNFYYIDNKTYVIMPISKLVRDLCAATYLLIYRVYFVIISLKRCVYISFWSYKRRFQLLSTLKSSIGFLKFPKLVFETCVYISVVFKCFHFKFGFMKLCCNKGNMEIHHSKHCLPPMCTNLN